MIKAKSGISARLNTCFHIKTDFLHKPDGRLVVNFAVEQTVATLRSALQWAGLRKVLQP